MRDWDEIDTSVEDELDDEFSFGADADAHEFRVEDHLREYFMNGETNMMEDFEDLCDSALD